MYSYPMWEAIASFKEQFNLDYFQPQKLHGPDHWPRRPGIFGRTTNTAGMSVLPGTPL